MLQIWLGFCLVFLLNLQDVASAAASSKLKAGFYKKTCPRAESIVRGAVRRAFAANKGIAAGLIRLHFHDCFVRGCDASILLNGSDSELMNPNNFNSLRGFEVVELAKALLEAQCPKTVSCADILAFAARDAAEITFGLRYYPPGGRRDGRISRKSDADALPLSTYSVERIRDMFAEKGLSLEDMVALAGAHSLGVTHCLSFSERLYRYNATHQQDPSMDVELAKYLKGQCPPPGMRDTTVVVPLDGTPDRFDVLYYKNLKEGKGLLASDQAMWTSNLTAGMVDSFAKHPLRWWFKFAPAQVRMGTIDVLTENEGEIRVNCFAVNSI